ncbi:hypothetical protein LSTR_LSTR009497 [Laodelphax striatellus]|uniref:Uncharacterized protein n=1 Tax=Laodelphax striatellus TaxID=195883 RepID=A0A482WEK6_LAOST|nr:hypothetical protein LSTR_LSTR009497 [Laodelphax striatellus]
MSASWPCTEIRLNSINYNGNDLLVADRCFQISQAGQYSRFLMKLTIDPPSPGDPSTTNLEEGAEWRIAQTPAQQPGCVVVCESPEGPTLGVVRIRCTTKRLVAVVMSLGRRRDSRLKMPSARADFPVAGLLDPAGPLDLAKP